MIYINSSHFNWLPSERNSWVRGGGVLKEWKAWIRKENKTSGRKAWLAERKLACRKGKIDRWGKLIKEGLTLEVKLTWKGKARFIKACLRKGRLDLGKVREARLRKGKYWLGKKGLSIKTRVWLEKHGITGRRKGFCRTAEWGGRRNGVEEERTRVEGDRTGWGGGLNFRGRRTRWVEGESG